MKLGVPKEIRERETRIATTPESVKKLSKKGIQVIVEAGAGIRAGYSDEDFVAAGAQIGDAAAALGSDIVFKIHPPVQSEIAKMRKGALLISLVEPYNKNGTLEALASAGVSTIGMELVPRTSRAQSMDVLSSQGNIAGYRAVIEAAAHYSRFMPMMMTSAGSAKPVKLAILGVGVAGLQAIATARRLGATVEAYDVRSEVKEQIISLGAKPMDISLGEEGAGQGGYAKELSPESQKKLQDLLSEKLKKFDIIVSTANVPGRKSPVLIPEETVKGMRMGSVIIDMAAANGGNCPLTEADKIVVKNGVTLVGITNYPALMSSDASNFFGRNLITLLFLMIEEKDGKPVLNINLEDDIIAAALATHNGAIVIGKNTPAPAPAPKKAETAAAPAAR